MDNSVVIDIRNLRKIFRYFKKDYKVFQWLFTRKGYTKEFKVLNGINLQVKKGEVVGILGKNGAGKSTLLKIISSIYFPTGGRIDVKGSIASLIELGAGFNRELTGRENIYYKGTLLGLNKEYIEEHIDEIISFADIGEYIDMPLGTYSSGMQARLGFSLAVNADADILIIDEVFAVGDKNFQTKSREKTEELLKSNKTVLFVSHSESLIREFCNRVVYLKDGVVAYDGEVGKGITTYHLDNLNLKKVPTMSYLESEIEDTKLRLRFEIGLGAEGNVITKDNIAKYKISINHYDEENGKIFEENTIDFDSDQIDDTTIDLYLNGVNVLDDGYFSVNFEHPELEDLGIASLLKETQKEDLGDYKLSLKNNRFKFLFKLQYNDDNNKIEME